jgi:hypothetical protein
MKKLVFLALVFMIAVSLVPQVRTAEATQSTNHDAEATLSATEACLRKIVWLNLLVSAQLKARWYNILRFCYNGVEITDWQLRWRPQVYVSNWRYVRMIGPRISGNPFRAMLFQTEAVFVGIEGGQRHVWRPILWQRAFPNGQWTFGGQQQYW